MRQKLILIALCAGINLHAQDSLKTIKLNEMVVTGSRSETPIEKSGKMIFRFSKEDIEMSGGRSISDLLNKVPGIQIDGNFGAPGTNIGYFVRGASSKRTLILIDGVPFNDPSGIDLSYDLRLLDMSQVESIEVLRGGLSSLYGTGAAAAVINIKLKKAQEGELNARVGMDVASFNTVATLWNANGRIEKVSYSISGGQKTSEGFSSAKDLSGVGNFDKDGMNNENALIRVAYDISKTINVELTGAYDYLENQFDFGSYIDEVGSGSEYFQKKLGAKMAYSKERTNFTASHFQNRLERRFNYGGYEDDYEAINRQSNFQLTQHLGTLFTVIGGVDAQSLQYHQPSFDQVDFTSTDPYLSWILDAGTFNFQMGGRMNVHSDYGSHFVYNINPSYSFDLSSVTLKVLANYATNFITPSLYQLHGPFGNGGLNPEESTGWDGGASIYSNRLELNLVYFQRSDNRPIAFQDFFDNDFNWIGGEYYNATGTLEVEGVEMDFKYSVEKFNLSGSYAWLNNTQGNLRLRIPRLKAGVGISYQFSTNGSAAINYNWTGKREQTNPLNFEQILTPSYGLVDLSASQTFGKFFLRGAINNLLDEKYDAILGFNTMGRNYILSAGVNLGK